MASATAGKPSQGSGTPPGQRAWQFVRGIFGAQVSSAARERRDTIVLLLALGLVVLPHFEHIAWWAISVLTVLWVWRLWLALSQRPLPPRFAMLPLLIGATLAVFAEHRTLLGRDAGVTFLLMLLALKLLEMRAKRDVFVVIFLAFFILLTQFLFGQGIVVAVLTLLAVALLFFVLVSVNLAEIDLPAARKASLVGGAMLKAVPLTLALFLLFPRLNGPLWGMPGEATGTRTGLSQHMTPGAIGRLLESDQIAFRVRFDAGAPPLLDQLYWRGPVLGQFTGRTWTSLAEGTRGPSSIPLEVKADRRSTVEYTVTLEPHQRDWLFALEWPAQLPALDIGTGTVRMNEDGQLFAGGLITERQRYTVRSYTQFNLGLNETPLSLRVWTQLPSGYNPRTLALASELRRTTPGALESRAADPQLVNAVLTKFRKEDFRYTLEPPLLGRNSVDEFLFDTRQGFCEHYASAFVTLMRALDIPARVVTGYQGGEFNPVDGYLTVRQSDAHAWAEVWLDGRGWVRVDPTGAVAPERVQRGTRAARHSGPAVNLGVGQRAFDLWRTLRFNWEAMENGWNQWVLSYSVERQRSLLRNLGLEPSTNALAVLLAFVVCVLLAVLAYVTMRHREKRDALGEIVGLFRARLATVGAEGRSHLGPRDMALQLRKQLDEPSYTTAQRLLAHIELLRYSRAGLRTNAAQLRKLKREVKRFRPRAA
jgi:transglutaminase-like putative cysteine protease